MSLRHMEVFRAIMLAGSVSAAARMLFVSQSVVSRTLAHLESRIGFQLFLRAGGALRPTENALALLKDIEDVFVAAERVDAVVGRMGLPQRDRVAFSASPSLGLSIIPSAISKFKQRDPTIRFSVRTSMVDEMPAELLGKSSEFCISIWPVEHPNLQCTPLFTGRLRLAIPAGHRLSAYETVPLDELSAEPLVSFISDLRISAQIRKKFQDADVTLDPFVEVSRSELACALVRRNVAVALIYSFSVDDDLWNGLEIRDIDIDIPVTAFLVTSNFSPPSDLAERFIRTARAAALEFGYESVEGQEQTGF